MDVVTYSPNPFVRQRVRSALSGARQVGSVRLAVATEWNDVLARCGSGAFEVAVVTPRGCDDPFDERAFVADVEDLAARVRPHRVVFYLPSSSAAWQGGRTLTEAGFSFRLTLGMDDEPWAIRRVIAAAVACTKLTRMLSAAGEDVPPSTRAILMAVFEAWPPPESVAALASRLHVSERSLRRHVRQAGLPAPWELARWATLFHARALRRLGVSTATALAFHLGLSDASSLCRTCRTLTGRPLGAVVDEDWSVDDLHPLLAHA